MENNQTDNLDTLYKEAFQEFGSTKMSRETDKIASAFIKSNFKPEADVLKAPADKWSSIFQESKASAKERLREYLSDTVSEFVDTNVLTGTEFFEVLLEVVYDNWQFYQKNADENKTLLETLQNVKDISLLRFQR